MTVIYGYISTESHGGECCGVCHMYNFPDLSDMIDDLDRQPTLADKIETIQFYLLNSTDGCTVEVVLTRQQAKVWERALQRCGFKRVMEFRNPNTGNILRMYLSTNNVRKPKSKKEGK